jgi:outer membrane protein assembly factor BamA
MMRILTKGLMGACLLAGAAWADPPAAASATPQSTAPQSTEPQTKGRTGWFGAPIAAYTPETGAAFGAAVVRYFMLPGGRDSVARLDARYTTRKQLIVRSRNRIYWNDNFLRTWVSYERFPDFYYGLGGDTPNDPETYTPIEWRGEVVYERRIWRQLFVGGAYELTHLTLEDVPAGGRLDSDARLVGRDGGWQSGLGVQLTWDDRDNVNATRDGTFARASVMAFDGLLGSTHDYQRVTLDARRFIPLPFEHVLAMRALASSRGGDTPFYDLSMLGGRTLMRGIYEGRFRDNHLLAFQLEYRLPVWWRFGLAAFAATGQVGESLGDLDFSNSRLSGGAGIRFAISQPSRLNARIDLGASADGAKLYLTFNEAF